MPAPELLRAWLLVQAQAQELPRPRVVPVPGQEPLAQRAAPQGQLAVFSEQLVPRKEAAAVHLVPRQEAASAQQPAALEARAQWPAIMERGRGC